MNKSLLLALCFLFSMQAYSQERPYPQEVRYSSGYMSSGITTQHATKEYEDWITAYYVECTGTDEARINYNGNSVSEGIGYGLVITAYAGDKDKFDKLLNYYNNRKNGNGLMNWEYSGCGTQVKSSNGATDGDLDAVMGMLVAVHQWPGQGYETHFEKLCGDIKTHEFEDCNGTIIQKPGDAWGGCGCSNPSYYAPGYYRAFAMYYGEKGDSNTADWWNKAADDSYIVLFKNQHETSGLVTAWTNSDGSAGPCGGAVGGGGGPDTYQYDACRTPWRIANDYLWWGSEDAKTFLTNIAGFVNSEIGDLSNVVDGYDHDGKATGQWHNVPFVGSFALCGMASSQTDANKWLTHFATLSGDNYFNTCLAVMYKFLATGNYWNPYQADPPGPICSKLYLGTEKTLCGAGSVELNAGVATHSDRTFSWFRDGAPIQSGSSNSFTADQAGSYSVVMDSAEACTSETSVEISASLPLVNLGGDKQIGASTELDAQIEGSGIAYAWYKDGSLIAGENQRTLTASEEGTYRVEISATGCSPQEDEVVLTKAPFISMTADNISIDGTKDDAYTTFRELPNELSGTAGAPNIAARWAGVWDNSNLYLFIEVTDDNLSNDSGDSWYEDDGVEVFIDGDNSKKSGYDNQNDFQWCFVWQASSVYTGNSNPSNSTSGIQFTTTAITGGYTVEVSIPWSTIGVTPAIDNLLGIDIQVNDDDNGNGRENKISWNGTLDETWQNPSLMGEAVLAGETNKEETQTVQLKKGWNLLSFYVQPENSAIESVFAGQHVLEIKSQNGFWNANQPDYFNSLKSITAGEGYLVNIKNAGSLTITGQILNAEVMPAQLAQGWNLIGIPYQNTTPISTIFNTSNCQIIKDFNGYWQPYGGTYSINNFEPGKAYFIRK